MLIHVHVSPSPLGDERGTYAHVEAAIQLIERSGLEYEVGALGTTVQGEPDAIWALMRGIHESCLESGADHVMTHVRIMQGLDETAEISMSERVALIT